eukprot:2068819-Prorocentrum_lima.AAC.1
MHCAGPPGCRRPALSLWTAPWPLANSMLHFDANGSHGVARPRDCDYLSVWVTSRTLYASFIAGLPSTGTPR